jgi:hypothetical protein
MQTAIAPGITLVTGGSVTLDSTGAAGNIPQMSGGRMLTATTAATRPLTQVEPLLAMPE